MLKPHTGMVIVKGRLCSGKLTEGTEINVSVQCCEMARGFWSHAGVAMRFGRMPWKQTLLGWLTRVPRTPMDDFSVASPMNHKDFLKACGLLQTIATAGLKETKLGLTWAWSWSRASSLPFCCSSSPLWVAISLWLAPMMVCGSRGAWMYGSKRLSGSLGGGALVRLATLTSQSLRTCLDRREEGLPQLSFLWGSGKNSQAVALC